MTDVAKVTAKAPAKINLSLDCLSRRDDGFHEIRSLVIGVDLADQVTCAISDGPDVRCLCEDQRLSGQGNLAALAAKRLGDTHAAGRGVAIELNKSIPVASGMGGGSSDAATTLRLCRRLWGLDLTDVELAAIGATIGSDVPLFFSLPCAVISGRGERVAPATLGWRGYVLLMTLDVEVSTAAVYRAWRPEDSQHVPSGDHAAILEATSESELTPLLSNQLERAVFRTVPAMARARTALNDLGIGPVRVTGAGSTFYRLFDEAQAAESAARDIEEAGLGLATRVVAAPVGLGDIVC